MAMVDGRLLLQAVDAYNRNGDVHGILVQLPMPSQINEQRVLDTIAAEKDVDGFSPANIGKLAMRGREPNFVACTPKVYRCRQSPLLIDNISVKFRGVLKSSMSAGSSVQPCLCKSNAPAAGLPRAAGSFRGASCLASGLLWWVGPTSLARPWRSFCRCMHCPAASKLACSSASVAVASARTLQRSSSWFELAYAEAGRYSYSCAFTNAKWSRHLP